MRLYPSQFFVEFFIALLIGCFVGAFLVYAFGYMSNKWVLFLIGSIVGISSLILYHVAIAGLSQVILLAAIFLIPLHYDINFLYVDEIDFVVDANGISINLFDLLFFPLVFQWILTGIWGKGGSFSFDSSWTAFLVLIFLFHLVASVFSPHPFFSFSMLFWSFKAYAIFYYILNNIKEPEFLRTITHTLLLSLLFESFVVIEQKFVGVIFTAERLGQDISITSLIGLERVQRLGGTFTHPNQLAMFINLLLPICIFFLINEKNRIWQIISVLAIIVAVLAELWTQSRGGWSGLVVSMVVSTYLLFMKKGYNLVKVTLVTGFLGLFTFTLLFAASSSFRNRLTGEDYGTADLRIPLMAVAKNIISQYPLGGIGLNVYSSQMKKFDNTPEYVHKYYPHPVHNTYLLMAAETGIPSMVIFFLFIVMAMIRVTLVFWRGSGNIEMMALGILGAMFSWLMHNLVNMDHVFVNYTLWIYLGLIAAMEIMLREEKIKKRKDKESNK